MELNKKKLFVKALIAGKIIKLLIVLIIFLMGSGCTISYKMNGASIDYTRTKSIAIADFPNRADLVYAPLSAEFSEALRDIYSKQTRLQVLKQGGDMQLEGEIVSYFLTPMGIGADSYASQTKLTLTVNVRFTNKQNPADDFEKQYTAFETFDSNLLLTDIQDDLVKTMTQQITENIYNDTVAKW